MSRNLIVISLLFALLYPTASFADPPALEATSDGDVSVDSKLRASQEITVSKANITSVLHLTPLINPPANPSPGDIYFTTANELLIYANGKWSPIVSASASHGTKLFTSGSGTWTVPAGIYSLTVTLAGGGGGTTVFGDLSASGGQGGNTKASGSGGSPSGTYPYGPYGQGGAGSASCDGVYAGSGASGALYIQY